MGKETGMEVYAALPRGGASPDKIGFKRPFCLAIGSEAHGLSDNIIRISRGLTLPMRKGVESLNAAAAGAVLLYLAALKK